MNDRLASLMGGRSFRTMLMVFAAIVLLFFLRLIFLQLIVADNYSAMAQESRTASFTTNARRGTIYDRNGIVLATSVECKTIYANPAEIDDPEYVAEKLSEILKGSKQDYYEIIAESEHPTFTYIKKQADEELAEEVKALELDGIYFIDDMRREYPNGSIGGQIVGFCNDEGEGLTGLELQYDEILHGEGGVYVIERGNGGMPIPGGGHIETPAVDGMDIMVSLDIRLQATVEDALAKGCAELETDDGGSIIMDAETGEILAMASLPYMDPSDMANSRSDSISAKTVTQALEPGSVFKAAACMSILEHEAMGPDTEIFCPAKIEADGYEVTDSHERDDQYLSLRQIMNESSNIGISLATDTVLGFERYYTDITQYKFGQLTGIDYPGESSGYVPAFESWGKITGWNITFGQGLSSTPLQIVRFYGAILNDGIEVTPHFLIAKPQTDEEPEYPTEQVIDNTDALPVIRSILRSVVTDGTAKDADLEGYEVCGKTSTAEIADTENGGYKKEVYNLCFTGFIDNASKKLVCYVGADNVNGMRQTTKVFHDIMASAVDQYNVSPLNKNI